MKELSNKSTNSGIFETIYIDDKTYQIELENDLSKSQEQTKFYISKVNDITAHYTKTISEKDELINELTDKLESTKKDLTTDITKRNIDKELESLLEYAYSERYGFLTSCLSNVGTGLRASVMVHLPGLTYTRKYKKSIKGCKWI